MAWGIKRLTFRLGCDLEKKSNALTTPVQRMPFSVNVYEGGDGGQNGEGRDICGNMHLARTSSKGD